jgi:2-dehydro-3-deoxygluconokinase
MPPRFDFVTLGETMIRLSPPNFERLARTQSLDIQIGGTESNVAVNLARLGFKTSWMSRLPDNALGRRVVGELNAYGVDASGVTFASAERERMGTYFIELAVPPRPNRVIYDRANSAASRMTPADVNLDLLASARWFHMTGITPALSDSCRQVTADALRLARERGIVTSFDVNYRVLLWSPQDACRELESVLPLCDYIFVAHRDAISLFGAHEDPREAAKRLRERFGCKALVLTMGESGAVAVTADERVEAPQRFKVPQIVDRIGAGDAFDAGFIAAQMWGMSLEGSLGYGNAMSALKLTIPGDLALVTKDEVDQLVGGARSASLR